MEIRVSAAARRLCVLALIACAVSIHGQNPPSADTYVASSTPTANYGNSTSLVVQSDSRTYLQFDLSGLPSDLTANNIQKASLRLFVNNVMGEGSFDVYESGAAWAESDLTWSNQLSNSALVTQGTCTAPTVQCVTAASGSNFLVFDITQAVQDWVSGNVTNHGLIMEPSNGSSIAATFDSKESTTTSHEPELMIVLTGGPAGPTGPQGPTGAQGPTGSQGSAGTNGQGFNFRGALAISTTYNPYDVVTSGGQTYEVTTGYTTPADLSSYNAATDPNLTLIAAAGAVGPQGPSGATPGLSSDGNGGIVVSGGISDGGATLPPSASFAAGAAGAWPVNTYFTSAPMPNSGLNGWVINKPSSSSSPFGLSFQIDNVDRWEIGMDFQNQDQILAYDALPSGPYGVSDMLRVTHASRQFMFGPEVTAPQPSNGQFNFAVPSSAYIPAGIQLSPFCNAAEISCLIPNANDFVQFNRNQDADRLWLAWHQGGGTADWRIGMEPKNGYDLDFYSAAGSVSSPTSPGNLVMSLLPTGVTIPNLYPGQISTQSGDLYLSSANQTADLYDGTNPHALNIYSGRAIGLQLRSMDDTILALNNSDLHLTSSTHTVDISDGVTAQTLNVFSGNTPTIVLNGGTGAIGALQMVTPLITTALSDLTLTSANHAVDIFDGQNPQILSIWNGNSESLQFNGSTGSLLGMGGDLSLSSNTGSVDLYDGSHVEKLNIYNGAKNTIVLDAGSGTVTATSVQVGGSGGPNWTTGPSAPTGSCANGSLYTNQSGTPNGRNNLYECSQGAWLPVM